MKMEGSVIPEKKHKIRLNWKKELWSWTKTIGIIIIVVMVVRTFLFTNYIVYGKSMMPTIYDGERIIVNKIGYELHEPDRFDLVIFHATEDTDYIKRVIGLPGDHIAYKDDVLYVNGTPFYEEFLDDYRIVDDTVPFTNDFTLESVTNSKIVPEGYVFVLGDNRRNSLDSRSIGFVRIDVIVGKANMSYWPPNNFRFF